MLNPIPLNIHHNVSNPRRPLPSIHITRMREILSLNLLLRKKGSFLAQRRRQRLFTLTPISPLDRDLGCQAPSEVLVCDARNALGIDRGCRDPVEDRTPRGRCQRHTGRPVQSDSKR